MSSCPCMLTSKVVDSRTTKAKGYDWVPEGVRYRKRRCKNCSEEFDTYEGTEEELLRMLDRRFRKKYNIKIC
jgi:transcriptional regulator NrdR family protein